MNLENNSSSSISVATLGAGCFWCVEAMFQRLRGVEQVISGYAGGHVEHPSYKAVCSGETGHAEVCRIEFDESVISFETLLEVFFTTHDPTTLNRQGGDVGTQYRSVIFYHDMAQKATAEQVKAHFDAAKIYPDPIVTEISPLTNYYDAENYHQNYFNDNPNQGYCSAVVNPKVQKFRAKFTHLLKDVA